MLAEEEKGIFTKLFETAEDEDVGRDSVCVMGQSCWCQVRYISG